MGGAAFRRAVAGAVLLSSGCAPEPAVVTDPELRAELGIPDDTPIHRIELSGLQAENRVVPRVVEARPGDVVQFVVMDNRVHLIRFLAEEVGAAEFDFLRSTFQDRPPPLVERGARLVLTFEGAPPGTYPFSAEGNGSSARGEIRVLRPGGGVPRDP